jgi:hypothetical protein
MRNPLALLVLLVAAGCAPKEPTYTVMDRTLTVKEQNYGQAQGIRYCDNLANGQYLLLLSDFQLCGFIHADAGAKSFHTGDATNLRIVFPSMLKVTTNEFKVGTSNCKDTTAPGTEAVAWFSHNDPDTGRYDLDAQADSGTITITSTPEQIKQSNTMKGTFDLSFGGAKVSGPFDAAFCSGIHPDHLR